MIAYCQCWKETTVGFWGKPIVRFHFSLHRTLGDAALWAERTCAQADSHIGGLVQPEGKPYAAKIEDEERARFVWRAALAVVITGEEPPVPMIEEVDRGLG